MTQLATHLVVGISMPDEDASGHAHLVEPEENVVKHALWFAAATGCRVTFLSVIEDEDVRLTETGMSIHDLLRERQEPLLQGLVQRARGAGVDAGYRLRTGSASATLAVASSELDADLVLVSPRRTRKLTLAGLLHGSTTERLLRKASTPVWVIHPDSTPGLHRIAVAADFSSVTDRCLQVATALADRFGSSLHLVHAVDYPNDIALRRLPEAETAVAAYHAQVKKKAGERIDALLGADASRWQVSIQEDWIVRALPHYVADHRIDLVVMGSAGRSGLVGFFIGNTAEKLVRHIDGSLWVLKPGDWKPA
jgi:nucleotide-binding universal stress UspA family protein